MVSFFGLEKIVHSGVTKLKQGAVKISNAVPSLKDLTIYGLSLGVSTTGGAILTSGCGDCVPEEGTGAVTRIYRGDVSEEEVDNQSYRMMGEESAGNVKPISPELSEEVGTDTQEENPPVVSIDDFILRNGVPLDWPVDKPIYTYHQNDVVKEEVIGREMTQMSNVKLELFLNPEDFSYDFVASWEVNKLTETSRIEVREERVNRLTKESDWAQIRIINNTANSLEVLVESNVPEIDEDRKYHFFVTSYLPAGSITYDFILETPPLASFDANCDSLIDHGSSDDKIDLIFFPSGYPVDKLGQFNADVTSILYSHDTNSLNVMERVSFFEIPIFEDNYNKFNVKTIPQEVPCCFDNQLISIAKSCGYDKSQDFIFVITYEENQTHTGIAAGIGYGNWVEIPRTSKGTLLAHELGHLLNLDEEYYLPDKVVGERVTSSLDAPNCNYGYFNCDKWCEGVDAELVELVELEKGKYAECKEIYRSGDDLLWGDFCLNVLEGSEGFCDRPLSELPGVICYQRTIADVELLNIGVSCQEGFGCYTGCGGDFNFTRSSPASIMGAGPRGWTTQTYLTIERSGEERLRPDFSVAANEALRNYFDNN